MSNELTPTLRTNLQQYANPKTKTWQENCVKDNSPFLGFKMAIIRTELRHWHKAYGVRGLPWVTGVAGSSVEMPAE